VTVEAADLDRDVLEQPRRFAFALTQKLQVVGIRRCADRDHAVHGTTRDGGQPVRREIRSGSLAQNLEDFAERRVVNSGDAGLRTSERLHLELLLGLRRFEQMPRTVTTVENLYSPAPCARP
jgi:hypothetical protein